MPVREMYVCYHTHPNRLSPEEPRTLLTSPPITAQFLHSLLDQETVEVFVLLCLDTRHRLIGYHELSRGTLDAALVHPREVYKVAILANAASIILAHNHPSGDPSPSPDDRQITDVVVNAGRLLQIAVLDHIIIGDRNRYLSFREAQLLP